VPAASHLAAASGGEYREQAKPLDELRRRERRDLRQPLTSERVDLDRRRGETLLVVTPSAGTQRPSEPTADPNERHVTRRSATLGPLVLAWL
jgi:hypothetical protein